MLLDDTLLQITSEILTLNLMTNQVKKMRGGGANCGIRSGGRVAKPAPFRDYMKIARTLVPLTEGANLTPSNGMLPRLGSNY